MRAAAREGTAFERADDSYTAALTVDAPKLEKRPAATSQLGSKRFAGYIEGAVRYIAAALQSRRCYAAQAPDVLSNRGLICASTSPSVLGGRLGTYVAQVVHLIRPSSFGR